MPRFSQLNQFWRDCCVEAGFQFIDSVMPSDDPEFPDVTVDILAIVETLRNRNRPVVVLGLGTTGNNIQIYWHVEDNAPASSAGC